MTNDDTSSANPQALSAYAEAGLRIDAELETSAIRLAAVLAEFAATCREYPLGIDASLTDPLRAFARRTAEDDLWVRRVGEQFALADSAAAGADQTVSMDSADQVAAQAGNGDGSIDPSPLDVLGTAKDAALKQLGQWLGDGAEAVGEALPPFPDVKLDPNGPIARQARGQPINPLEWSQELAGYESQVVMAGAPDGIRNAQVTVTLPGVGQQTITTGALVAMALDPANLIGGPEDGAGVAAIEKALPYLSGAARAAAERLLGRAASVAPEGVERITGTALEEVESWVAGLRTTETPTRTAKDLYERAQTGPLNYLVEGGGKQVWADGVRVADANLLEAKYVENPARSPYIPGSDCPPFVRE